MTFWANESGLDFEEGRLKDHKEPLEICLPYLQVKMNSAGRAIML